MLDAKLKYLYTLHSPICGAIAQLVEHLHGMQGVNGSTPFSSTILFIATFSLLTL